MGALGQENKVSCTSFVLKKKTNILATRWQAVSAVLPPPADTRLFTVLTRSPQPYYSQSFLSCCHLTFRITLPHRPNSSCNTFCLTYSSYILSILPLPSSLSLPPHQPLYPFHSISSPTHTSPQLALLHPCLTRHPPRHRSHCVFH